MTTVYLAAPGDWLALSDALGDLADAVDDATNVITDLSWSLLGYSMSATVARHKGRPYDAAYLAEVLDKLGGKAAA